MFGKCEIRSCVNISIADDSDLEETKSSNVTQTWKKLSHSGWDSLPGQQDQT